MTSVQVLPLPLQKKKKKKKKKVSNFIQANMKDNALRDSWFTRSLPSNYILFLARKSWLICSIFWRSICSQLSESSMSMWCVGADSSCWMRGMSIGCRPAALMASRNLRGDAVATHTDRWDGLRLRWQKKKKSNFCWLKESVSRQSTRAFGNLKGATRKMLLSQSGEVCLLDWSSLGFSLRWGIFSLQNRLVYVNMHACECVCSRRYKTRQATVCSRERSMTTGWEQSILSTCFQQAPEPLEIIKGLGEEHSYSYCCHCKSL